METDIRDFIRQFTLDALLEKGVFNSPSSPAFQGRNVEALLALMRERGITKLTAAERNWHLTSEGEFANPSSKEIQEGSYLDLERLGNVFTDQNPHINPYWRYCQRDGLGTEDYDAEFEDELHDSGATIDTSGDSFGVAVGLERDLQRALRTNITQLSQALSITDGGREKSVVAGRIDITAEDANGNIVVIELKAGIARPESIAQLLAYMGTIENPDGKPVLGILVANDFHPRVIHAAKAVPTITLKAYSIQFNFQDR